MANVVDIAIRAVDQTRAGVQSATQSTSALGKAAKVAALAGAGAAAGLIAIFKTGVDEQSDFLKGQAQLAAGIKSTGGAANVTVDQLEDLAGSIQNVSGQTDDSIVAAEQLLLTFTNIKNVGPDKIFDQATQAAADMAARMGGDASSKAIILGKALNDPVQGITALTRVGVSFTDQQKAQIAAMQKSGDTIGAQKIILGELNKEFGGSAKAAGESLPGQLARGRRAFEDLSQKLVAALMPALIALTNILIKYLIPFLQKTVDVLITVGKWVSRNRGWLLPLAAAILAVVVALKIWAAVQIVLNVILTANPIGIVIVAIAALATGIYLLIKYFHQITDFLGGKWGTIISAAIAVIFPFIGIPMLILGHWQMLWGGLQTVWAAILTGWYTVRDGVMTGVNAVVGFFTALPGRITAAVVGAYNSVKNGATDAWKWVKDKVDAIIKFFTDLGGNIAKGVAGAFAAVGSAFQWLYDHSIGPILDAINKINSFFNQQVSGHGSPAPGALQKAAQMYGNQLGNAGHEPSNKGPGRAYGGSVTAGMSYPVGERGAEWFTPATNGRVTPQGGGGGQTVVAFAGNTDTAFAQLFMSMIRSGQIVIRQQYVAA